MIRSTQSQFCPVGIDHIVDQALCRLPIPCLLDAEPARAEAKLLLAEPPVRWNRLWAAHINKPQTEAELTALRLCVQRGQPFGGAAWRNKGVIVTQGSASCARRPWADLPGTCGA